MAYLRRTVDTELDELFDDVPAIAIDGPKAVGKTTTAQHRAEGTLRLDDPATRSVTQADPSTILLRNRPLLVDEWQHVPAVWDVIRHSVDDDPHGGQFLLAGSATPYEQTRQHSGAGRIGRLRMRPMTLQERQLTEPTVSLADLLTGRRPALQGDSRFGLPEYVEEIVASGFPAIRTMRERARRFAIDSYLRNAVDKDVPEQGFAVRRPEAMMAWLRAYAAATSTTASYSQILDAATPGQAQKPARSTADSYRGVLASLWLLDPVPAWFPSGSVLNRLGSSPKHHLADPALAANLLGLDASNLLNAEGTPLDPASGTMLGSLFESLVTLCVRVPAQAHECQVHHLRTRNGDHEVDLVVERRDGRILALEVKLAATITDRDVKHLTWLQEELGPKLLDTVVISTGPQAYRRPDGIGVVPLVLLGL